MVLHPCHFLFVGEFLLLVFLFLNGEALIQLIHLLLQSSLVFQHVLHYHWVCVAVLESDSLLKFCPLLGGLLSLNLQFLVEAALLHLGDLVGEGQFLDVPLKLGDLAVLIFHDILQVFDQGEGVLVLILQTVPHKLFAAVFGLHAIEGLSRFLRQQPVFVELALHLRPSALFSP